MRSDLHGFSIPDSQRRFSLLVKVRVGKRDLDQGREPRVTTTIEGNSLELDQAAACQPSSSLVQASVISVFRTALQVAQQAVLGRRELDLPIPRQTRWASSSSTTPPTATPARSLAWPRPRRNIASTRRTSSSRLNGLVR